MIEDTMSGEYIYIGARLVYFDPTEDDNEVIIDDEYINELIGAFGGKENIKEVKTENGGRVAIEVNDLDLVNNDKIKELATSGVFITGNVVKTLYREDSQLVTKAIEERV